MNQPRRFATGGITFYPQPGDVLMCDFDGYAVPEIVKIRPVVVLSCDSNRGRLCIVVPFSTQEPTPLLPVHFHVAAGRYPFARQEQWVKGDLIAHVSFERLDRIRYGGKYRQFKLPKPDFAAIQGCVMHATGLAALAQPVKDTPSPIASEKPKVL